MVWLHSITAFVAHRVPEIEAPAFILFLCTGNYYRSRFAELLFNAYAEQLASRWRADSAGLAPECFSENPGPIAPVTLEALKARGVHVAAPVRSPRAVCPEDFARARHVIAMSDAEHRPMLRVRFPAWEPRVEYWDVHDVDGAPVHEALALIEREVQTLIARFEPHRPHGRP